MTDPLASVSDFETRHGTLDSDDQNKVESLLGDASALITDHVEALFEESDDDPPDWVTEESPSDVPRVVQSITISVAYRAWSNPDALSQMSIGNTALSYVRGGIPDAIFLTDREKRQLRRAAGSSSTRTVTLVSPYSGDQVESTGLLGG